MNARPANDADLVRLGVYWASMQTARLLARLIAQSREDYLAARTPTRAAAEDAGVFTNDLSAADVGDGLQDLGDGCYRHLASTNIDGDRPDPIED